MPTATTNLHYWFYTLFTEMYEVYDHEDEKDTRDNMIDMIKNGNSSSLEEWCEEQLVSTEEIKTKSLLNAMLNTVDWVELRLELLGWFKDNHEFEETCISCEETKRDIFCYTKPRYKGPVCKTCVERQETCRCCEIVYRYYQLKWEGHGKFICTTCDEECPCDDPKCGAMCPGKKTNTVHVYPPLSSQNTVQNTDF